VTTEWDCTLLARYSRTARSRLGDRRGPAQAQEIGQFGKREKVRPPAECGEQLHPEVEAASWRSVCLSAARSAGAAVRRTAPRSVRP